MSLTRILEPEVMDSDEDARDYDAMNHTAVNAAFCEDLLALTSNLDPTVDVGGGTALIPIELCRRAHRARVVAIDLAQSMLRRAETNVVAADLSTVISLALEDAKALPYADGSFRCAISNATLHHIPDPRPTVREMQRVVRPGGVLFIRDLIRPETDDAVRAFCERHAADDNPHQRALLDASLRAAFSLDEVRQLAKSCDIPERAVQQTSDRHWTLTHHIGSEQA
jgi:ubiquinone/menaquinone biosynthesis C-methylase UbiE